MNILIIEDDRILSGTIKQCLMGTYHTEQAFDGEEGILYAKQKIYDVILLDIMLPRKDGYQVLTELRKDKVTTPVLLLTAKDSLNDKINGFEKGADDYLTKPFEQEELLARIKAIIRRSSPNQWKDNQIQCGKLRINLETREAFCQEQELNLQGKQFDLLEYLMRNEKRIITKEQIFNRIWRV